MSMEGMDMGMDGEEPPWRHDDARHGALRRHPKMKPVERSFQHGAQAARSGNAAYARHAGDAGHGCG